MSRKYQSKLLQKLSQFSDQETKSSQQKFPSQQTPLNRSSQKISSESREQKQECSNDFSSKSNSSFIISLQEFDQRNSCDSGENKSSNSIDSHTKSADTGRVSIDSDDKKRRAMIYGNQSYKESTLYLGENHETSMEANNQIFQMVFLANKNAKRQEQDQLSKERQKQQQEISSVSTAAHSFAKIKEKYSLLLDKKKKRAQASEIKIADFCLGKKLGSGKFGEVYLAQHIKSGFVCAIKKIPKQHIDKKLLIQLIREIKIQSFLSHPNIVKLYTFFSDQQFIYLVLEVCFSGQLYSFLRKKRKLAEPLTRSIVQQTLKALDYMHQNQIIHRDLKPENIIFQSAMVKLCDFGWSISSKTMRQTFCGTPLYISPELLKRKNYNNKIDVWSIGILTYELLFGRVPFDITTERDFIKIVQDEIKFSKATKISEDAKDFVLNCLQKDPNQRYTVAELLEHPFLRNLESVSAADMH